MDGKLCAAFTWRYCFCESDDVFYWNFALKCVPFYSVEIIVSDDQGPHVLEAAEEYHIMILAYFPGKHRLF